MLALNSQNDRHCLFLLFIFIVYIVCQNVQLNSRSQSSKIGHLSRFYGFRSIRDTHLDRTVSMKCKCGLKSIQKMRIVGGTESVPHSRPWIAALATGNYFLFCGGTIINTNYILTAAHCVYGRNPSDFYVILGLHDKWDSRQLHYGTSNIKSVTIHPDYDRTTVDNDIALLQLISKIQFNDRVRPACLPQFNTDFTGALGTVLGWGMVIDSGPTSRVLQEVNLPVLSNSACKSKYHNGLISKNMMCAGFPSGGQDACQGDSGGPMVYQVDGRWFVIGVISWGNGCARPNQPGVYTNVSRYIKWINSKTTNAVYCW